MGCCLTLGVTAGRVSSWLRFASRRLDGELQLSLPHEYLAPYAEEEIALPLCDRVTVIDMEYLGRGLRFRRLDGVHGAGHPEDNIRSRGRARAGRSGAVRLELVRFLQVFAGGTGWREWVEWSFSEAEQVDSGAGLR